MSAMSHPLDLLHLAGRRRITPVRQSEAAECGLACLAMVAGYHGQKTDIAALRRMFPISLKGMSLRTLIGMADDLGFTSRAIRAEIDDLPEVTLPAILHWNLNHFVVLTAIERRAKGTRYRICDPARGELLCSFEDLSRSYTGVTLELMPSERFQQRDDRKPLRISQMWTRLIGLPQALLQVFLLSFLLQLFSFAAPLYLQLAVDTAIPSFDLDFLTALAAGFGGMALLNILTTTLRSVVLLKLGSAMGYQLVANLFRQLVHLPMGYFEKRHTGDVISRFDSAQPITDMLTNGLIQAVIDAIMALGTLALMFFYAPLLAMLALAALVVTVLTRVAWFGSLQMANVGTITARAAESSTMIETVRGMAAIKLFAREGDRQRFWQNKRADVVNASIRMGRIQVWFDAANSAVMAFENVLFVYLAVRMTIEARFTVGMIFAFQSYKSQFLGAATRLVGQWVQFRLLDVHLSRIADIALTPAEPVGSIVGAHHRPPLMGAIDIRNLHFAYGHGEREVLRGVNLSVAAGETVAVIGSSGGGKTTLLKLLLGFYQPGYGQILIDGEDLQRFGLRRYRRQIGAVLQEDVLYAGSLAENIGFFDPELQMDRVQEVARLACIHDEIMAMPMAYETLVGDMGSTLSGGQKQRMLLARSLYARPRLLLLDEGTAHLDVRTEAAVNQSISALGITRLIIAHRPETIRMADRVVALVDGQVVEGGEVKVRNG